MTQDASQLVAAIRSREQAATPGPWRSRGNTDTGDPYLPLVARVTVDGRRRHAGDVLGHVPHEITRAGAEQVVSRDDMPVPRIAAEPAATYPERYEAALAGYMTDQHGQLSTEPRLAFCSDGMYTEARQLAVYEVCSDAAGRDDPQVYRADIARAREDLARLLDAAERVLAVAAKSEHQALPWEHPLPVPGWVGEVRKAIAGALGGAGEAGAQ